MESETSDFPKENQPVRPKKQFRGQFYFEDLRKSMFIAAVTRGHAPDSWWVTLRDADGFPIRSAFHNTLFSQNWIEFC